MIFDNCSAFKFLLLNYCVSLSPKNWVWGFFRLGLTSGSGFGACWDRGLENWTWA